MYANALNFNEEGDKYWMLAAQSFQQAAPLLQIAQDKFQTAASIDLPAIPSPMHVDVHQFVERQIGNLEVRLRKTVNTTGQTESLSELEALLLPPAGTPTVSEADLALHREEGVGLVPHQVGNLVDDRLLSVPALVVVPDGPCNAEDCLDDEGVGVKMSTKTMAQMTKNKVEEGAGE